MDSAPVVDALMACSLPALYDPPNDSRPIVKIQDSSSIFSEPIVPQGKIKKIVSDRGFGFIESDRGELFFHHSAVQEGTFDHLQEGDRVEFNVGQGKKGPCATEVRPVK